MPKDRTSYHRAYSKARYHKTRYNLPEPTLELMRRDSVDYSSQELDTHYDEAIVKHFLAEIEKWKQHSRATPPTYTESIYSVLKNDETQCEARRKWWRQTLLTRARTRASTLNKECTLQLEDIDIPPVCPILQTPLDGSGSWIAPSSSIPDINKPSLDRIDNEQGYVKGNIIVMSWKANRLKSDATLRELVALGGWAYSRLTS